jgi:hypothetical protein
MREKLGALLVGAAGTLALISAGPALGATYCVHQAGGVCAVGQVDEGSDLQQALADARDSVDTSSSIFVGPGTYAHNAGFNLVTPHEITLVGAGRGKTILEATGSNATVLQFKPSAASTVSGMTLSMDSHAGFGLVVDAAKVVDMEDVLQPSASADAVGAVPSGGAAIRDSTLRGGDLGSSGAGAVVNGPAVFDHDVLSGHTALQVGGPVSVTLQRSTLTEFVDGVSVGGSSSAELVADDDLLVLGPGAETGFTVGDGASAMVRSATIYSVFHAGTAVAAGAVSGGAHTSVTLLDSIIWNTPLALAASASGGGTSAITANFDDVGGGSTGGGLNATISQSNDINADPLFADPGSAGDYRLRFGSPAIDSGGSCAATCMTVADLQGLTRPIDGNGDGIAVRDMGAYEYARRAPSAAASVDRTSALTGELLAFGGTGSSDPDPGDALTYSWSFDDGSTASGQDVTHAFTTAGSHTATLTVTDPTGLTATAAATVTVAAPPLAMDTAAPSLTKVSLSPSTFVVARGRTAVSASRHHGTRIRFTLSEAAKVVATFQRCARKRHKRCHYVSAGSLTRRSEPRGRDSIAFTGRLGKHRLARGHYRMHLRATDPAGNRSKQKTASFHVV